MDMCSHNRNITANDIVAAMKTLYAVDTSTACAYRARNRLLASTYGSPEDSYIDLPAYLDELEDRNPGSEINLEDDDGVFQRSSIELKPRFEALRHCRKVISVDGTHLFSKYRGILLTATTLDADGHLYPLCYSVVSVENTSNWKYFFTHLKKCMQCVEVPLDEVIFLSDRQKGLLSSISEIFGNNQPHGYCVRHLVANCLRNFRKRGLMKLIWQAAGSTTVEDFLIVTQKIRILSRQAHDMLMDIKEHWTLCHFPCCRYGHLTSNISESFNSVIRETEGAPLIPLLESIREKMRDWQEKYAKASRQVNPQWS
ncbi:hypothetical protein GEMRC1_013119 [Eukaryota sp. GEM-RC1]